MGQRGDSGEDKKKLDLEKQADARLEEIGLKDERARPDFLADFPDFSDFTHEVPATPDTQVSTRWAGEGTPVVPRSRGGG